MSSLVAPDIPIRIWCSALLLSSSSSSSVPGRPLLLCAGFAAEISTAISDSPKDGREKD
jgi:hypothetical protein